LETALFAGTSPDVKLVEKFAAAGAWMLAHPIDIKSGRLLFKAHPVSDRKNSQSRLILEVTVQWFALIDT
jgi:hypothetical protein